MSKVPARNFLGRTWSPLRSGLASLH